MKITYTARFTRPSNRRAQKRFLRQFIADLLPNIYADNASYYAYDDSINILENDDKIEFFSSSGNIANVAEVKILSDIITEVENDIKKEIQAEVFLFSRGDLNNKHVNICVDTVRYDVNADYNFLLLFEPATKFPLEYKLLSDNHYNFDKIYTYDENLLNLYENAEFFLRGTSWLNLNNLNLNKNKQISFLMSDKNILPGQKFRSEVYDLLTTYESINLLEIFKHKSPPHVELFDYYNNAMFNMAIEHSVVKNFFTEKIVHCFLSKTIPIYYGCPNIGDWFDMDGIIIFNDIDELKNIFDVIDENYYNSRQKSIEKNYENAVSLCYNISPPKRLSQKIYDTVKK